MFGRETVTVLRFTKEFPRGSMEEALKELLEKTTAEVTRASIPAEVPEVSLHTSPGSCPVSYHHVVCMRRTLTHTSERAAASVAPNSASSSRCHEGTRLDAGG